MYTIIVSILIGIVIGALIFYLLTRSGRKNFVASEVEQPGYSEKAVEALLAKAGYKIVSKHPRGNIITNINGKDHFDFLEADYTVAREKQKYIAIVKTSTGTAEATDPLWRRRLMEASQVFGHHNVLFIDPEQGEIQEITFRFPKEKGIDIIFRWLIGIFIILLVFAIIWLLVNSHLI